MRRYQQFTYRDRVVMETMLKVGKSVSEISDVVGYTQSTIYREMKRGAVSTMKTGKRMVREYSADYAELMARRNASNKGAKPKLRSGDPLTEAIERLILEKNSPEVASNRIKETLGITVCAKTIYNAIDRRNVFFHLRRQHLIYRKQKEKPIVRLKRPKVIGEMISDRPKKIESREEFGHWEMDTVAGTRERGYTILALTERKTRKELLFLLRYKRAEHVCRCLGVLKENLGDVFSKIFRSITVDNGKEFSRYEEMRSHNNMPVTRIFYCNSYAAWQRGTNENQNRFIRRFCPKGKPIQVRTKAMKQIQSFMDRYPRRSIEYQTAFDMWSKEMREIGLEEYIDFFEREWEIF